MDKIKELSKEKSPHATAEAIKSADTATIQKILLSKDTELIGSIISTNDKKANNIIFNSISTKLLTESIIQADNNSTWNFLQSINNNQLSKISTQLSEQPTDVVMQLLKNAPDFNSTLALTRKFPIEKRVFFIKALEEMFPQTSTTNTKKSNQNSNFYKFLYKNKVNNLESSENYDHEQELLIKKKIAENDLAQIQMKLAETMHRHAATEQQIKRREQDLDKKFAELEEERKRQVQQRIEIKVPAYVSAAVDALEKRENDYKEKAKNWAIYGSIVLVVAILSTILISLYGTGIFNEKKFTELNWQSLVFISFKGLIVLGVLGLWAKHAFAVSNAYMHEAIKRSDRAHAINFGKLYLEIYGNSVDRKELIDIFENWNITSESAFAKVNSEFEPKIIEKFSDVVKSIQESNKK